MKFKIYSKLGCSSCIQAEQLLKSKGIEYEYLIFGKDYDMEKFMSFDTAHKSFPLITQVTEECEKYIGGLQDLKNLLNK